MLLPHACFVTNKFRFGTVGNPLWERLTGKKWGGNVVEFGEVALGKLARQGMQKTSNKGVPKRKLKTRWIEGIWLGLVERSGEHIIACNDGRAVRVRSVKRVPEQNRWNHEKIFAVKATHTWPTWGRSRS